jgi:uncharacterized protein (DUF1015 family)
MPQIRGFRAWRYNNKIVTDVSKVVAPPYDVISKKAQDEYYRRHPFNVIRLILGKKESSKNKVDWYSTAQKHLSEWQSKGILQQDPLPSLYVYIQDYEDGNIQKRRTGFIAAMNLDTGSVLKHENTLAAPKKDRLTLLKKVRTNLSPIFGLYEDRPNDIGKLFGSALKEKPVVDVTFEGVHHRLYKESRPKIVKSVSQKMKTKPMFIADGHHRFEVACQFQELMRRRVPKDKQAAWNYVMTYFSDCVHNPFKIYPTHRLLRYPKSSKIDLLGALAQKGILKKVRSLSEILTFLEHPRSQEVSSSKMYSFGIYTKKKGFYLLHLNPKSLKFTKNNPVEKLDVSVLHRMIIEPCFGIKAIAKSEAIDFTRDPKTACQSVDVGYFDTALFLRPTSLSEMIEVSKRGLKMPQKSTYFYPKLLTGLTFHSLEERAVNVGGGL